jgi:hypothetical protein
MPKRQGVSYEVSTRPRQVRKIMQGRDTVTPVRALVLTSDGREETLESGRDRLALDHPLVKAQPHLFRATDKTDERTSLSLELRQLEQRTTHSCERTLNYWLGPSLDRAPRSWL